jgi:threonine-phosphate decarboxylase
MYLHGGDVYGNLGRQLIDFSANMNFLGIPRSVLEAAYKGVEMSINYPQQSNTGLIEKISDYYKRTGIIKSFDSSNFIVGNGAAEVIFDFMNVVKPRTVLIPVPTFYEYEHAIKSQSEDVDIKRYYLDKDNDFKLNEEIFGHITDRIDMVCICNPNNPTGKLIDKGFVTKIIEKCKENNTWIFIDESFMDMVDNGREKSVCCELDNICYDKVFILKSFTKLFAMPGLRLGYGICKSKDTVNKMKEIIQPWNVSLPAQYAGMAAVDEMYNNCYDKLSAAKIGAERAWLYDRLLEIENIRVYNGVANFLLFNVLDENMTSVTPLDRKCREKGILIRNCENFIGLSQGWYRVAVKSREDNERLINCLKLSNI